MLEKLIEKLGGGIEAKVMLILMSVAGTAVIGLSIAVWHVSGKLDDANHENGGLRASIHQSYETIKGLNSSLVAAKKLQEDTDRRHENELKLVAAADAKKLARALASVERISTIKEVIHHDQKSETWARTRLPDAVLACLQPSRTAACPDPGSTAAGSKDTDPTQKPDG